MTIPDILVITHNRAEYVLRTLDNLFSDPAQFRVYIWDNASTDGAKEVVADWSDDRIAGRHFSDRNLLQDAPTRWFLETARSSVIGKVDDDTLVPRGWVERVGAAVVGAPTVGMVGCWTFMPEDFERNREAAMRKVVDIGGHQILRDFAIGGTAFLMRRSLAMRYLTDRTGGRSFPVDRARLTVDGFASGWYFPLLYAEHMDDPRSEHCLMNAVGSDTEDAALTVRARGFKTPAEYLAWIRSDADEKLTTPLEEQVRDYRKRRSLVGRLRSRATLDPHRPRRIRPGAPQEPS